MSRRYDDPVQVRRRDGVPAEFLWRTRLYVVRCVLDSWVETAAWWRAPSARGVYGLEEGTAASESADQTPTGMALDEVEREMWRVEASAGRLHGTGVFDLCFDWSTGCWVLASAVD